MGKILLCLVFALGCNAGEVCKSDKDCKGVRVCAAKLLVCVEPTASAAGDDLSTPGDEPDLKMSAQDMRGPASPPDLRPPQDLAPSPDLAPRSCIFDRDCGDAEARCCTGVCRKYLDRENCGSCGTACGPDPSVLCCGVRGAAYCNSIKTSKDNCGACGTVCPTVVRYYMGLKYQLDCCDGLCKDLNKDNNNCGLCGLKCPPPSMCFDAGGIPIGGNCG